MPPSFEPFPPETLRGRRERVFRRLERGAMILPAAPVRFSSRDTEYPYRPDSELYYLTGLTEPGVVAVLRGHADEDRFVVFVLPPDEGAELWHGARPQLEEVRERTGADAVYPLDELEERLPALLLASGQVHFRLDAEPRCDALVRRALRDARRKGARRGGGPRGVVDPGEILDELRLRKDPEEVERMRGAATITVAAYREALGQVKPGAGEWEIEATLEGRFRALGADGPAYGSIVASGPHGCVLHYVGNSGILRDGDLLLVDAGAALGLYAADVTRTLPVSGRMEREQRLVYDIVERARRSAVEAVYPGGTVAGVHSAAVRALVAGLIELGVLDGDPDELRESEAHKPFFPHQTSHWLGLDVHDPGDYVVEGEGRRLEPGMVLTVEPGLYFRPAVDERAGRLEGLAVRIEDDVLVTAEGHEILSAGLPTAADEVSALVGG